MGRYRHWAIATVVIAGGLSACTQPTAPSAPADGLAPGTARVTLDGTPMADEHRVTCTAMQFWTTITVGDPAAGLTAVIHNASTLATESVSIRNLGGFTGSYWRGLGQNADVAVDGSTFTIRGTATGFNARTPSMDSNNAFQIVAAC